jgi:transcription initiation factor TFIID subunit 1
MKVIVSDEVGVEIVDKPTDDVIADRVKLPLDIIDRERIQKKSLKRGIINADEHFKTRVRLSLQDGKFALFEHVDEAPLYLNNFGMVSNLERYIYAESPLPKSDFLPSSLKLDVKHMGPFGKQILRNANQHLPLLGRMDKSKYQGITVLSNKLYRAPVFFHRKNQRSEPQDFFCSLHTDRQGQRKIVVRELHYAYTVGQIEPIQKVYDPGSRCYQNFRKFRC